MQLTCEDCNKSKHCKTPCVFIDKLAGKGKSTRELLPPPNPHHAMCGQCKDKNDCITGRCEYTDYNMTLTEVITVRERMKKKNILSIRQLNDTRLKAISSLLYAGFKVSEIPYIVEILNIQRSRLYAIIKDNIKMDTKKQA
jgi:hypothetical protein